MEQVLEKLTASICWIESAQVRAGTYVDPCLRDLNLDYLKPIIP